MTILIFVSFNIKYYLSETNIKKSNRQHITLEKRSIESYNNLLILKNNTINIIEKVEKDNSSNKKRYKFFELLSNNEK
jgi:hypothetical protein|tara:strand:+ start:104 stop:337 length:234 start_codon:yes stop_codon:yes gene_type:complete